MKINRIYILLIILFSCSNVEKEKIVDENIIEIDRFIANNPGLETDLDPIDSGFLRKDLEVIKKMNEISDLKPTVNKFGKYCPGVKGIKYTPPNLDPPKDIGFGLTKSSCQFGGGYGTFFFEIVYYKNDILYFELLIAFISKNQIFIKENIIDHIYFPITCYDDNSIMYKKSFNRNILNFQNQSKFIISINENISEKYTADEIEMYEQLTNLSIMLFYDCGKRNCGQNRGRPFLGRGRIAIDSLSKMQSYELIEKAIYSLNPIGRIYALEELEKLDKENKLEIADSTKTMIDLIKSLDTRIDLCDWCMIENYTGNFTYSDIRMKLDSINDLAIQEKNE